MSWNGLAQADLGRIAVVTFPAGGAGYLATTVGWGNHNLHKIVSDAQYDILYDHILCGQHEKVAGHKATEVMHKT